MARRSRMDDCDRDFAAVPVGDILAGFDFPNIEALLDSLKVMLEPVGYQQRFAVRGLDDIFQCVQLPKTPSAKKPKHPAVWMSMKSLKAYTAMQLAMAIAAVIELPARRNAYPLLF